MQLRTYRAILQLLDWKRMFKRMTGELIIFFQLQEKESLKESVKRIHKLHEALQVKVLLLSNHLTRRVLKITGSILIHFLTAGEVSFKASLVQKSSIVQPFDLESLKDQWFKVLLLFSRLTRKV